MKLLIFMGIAMQVCSLFALWLAWQVSKTTGANTAYVKVLRDASQRGEPPDYCEVFRIIGHTEHSAKHCK